MSDKYWPKKWTDLVTELENGNVDALEKFIESYEPEALDDETTDNKKGED